MTKPRGCHIDHFLHKLSALRPRIKFWGRSELKAKAEGSESCRIRSWTRVRSLSFLQIDSSRPPGLGVRSRQTDSRSQPPLESGRDADAPLLFWEVDSSEEFIHKGRNGGGGGSGTGRPAWLHDCWQHFKAALINSFVSSMDQVIMCNVKGVALSSVERFSVFQLPQQAPLFCVQAWKRHTQNKMLPVLDSFWFLLRESALESNLVKVILILKVSYCPVLFALLLHNKQLLLGWYLDLEMIFTERIMKLFFFF